MYFIKATIFFYNTAYRKMPFWTDRRMTDISRPRLGRQLASFVVRDSRDTDVDAVWAIYAHHVLHSTASFEENPPSAEEISRRRSDVLARELPYFVAEANDGAVIGYSYAIPYRTRSAYRYTVENSVYVAHDLGRCGVGSALLSALLQRCAAGPWRQMVAIIGDSANRASIGLHYKHGFRMVGTLQAVGHKFGKWIDTVLMQRALRAHG
jgi:L-amino acid N-acyltransferase YncA